MFDKNNNTTYIVIISLHSNLRYPSIRVQLSVQLLMIDKV